MQVDWLAFKEAPIAFRKFFLKGFLQGAAVTSAIAEAPIIKSINLLKGDNMEAMKEVRDNGTRKEVGIYAMPQKPEAKKCPKCGAKPQRGSILCKICYDEEGRGNNFHPDVRFECHKRYDWNRYAQGDTIFNERITEGIELKNLYSETSDAW